MGDVEQWYRSIPIVTRTYATLATITMGTNSQYRLLLGDSAAVSTDLVSLYQLYLNWNTVITKGEIWRPITSFLYLGSFNIDFFFHLYFLYRYCKSLEENMQNRSADFFWMLCTGVILLLGLSPFFKMPFLGFSFTFMAVYVYGRKNEHLHMSFMVPPPLYDLISLQGLFNFTAPYLPWVLMAFSVLLGGGNILPDVMGVICGHIYYYLTDVYPRMSGRKLLATPQLVLWMFGQNRIEEVVE